MKSPASFGSDEDITPGIRRAGEFVFVAGTGPWSANGRLAGLASDADGVTTVDVRAQVHAALDGLDRRLATLGSGLVDIVDVTVYLLDINERGALDAVWREYFDSDGPVRTVVAVRALGHPLQRIELKAVAWCARAGASRPGAPPTS